jgi:hypothetical protein
MAIKSTRCAVLGGDVSVVTDFEGKVTEVICPQYEAMTGACRLKVQALEGGPLAQLLERVSEHGLDTRSTRCHLRAA